MASTYNELLTKSPQYGNLNSAYNSFNGVSYHIDELTRALANSSGKIIEETKEGFNGVGVALNTLMEGIKQIQQTMLANASRMDKVLRDWRRKAAYNEIIETTTSSPTYESIVLETVQFTQSASSPYDPNEKVNVDGYRCSVTVTVSKATSANIGSDGYIEVHFKKEITTYSCDSDHQASASEIISEGSGSTEIIENGGVYHPGF